MPPPIYFPANVSKLARLENPRAINAFYVRLEIMRNQKDRPGMENAETAPNKSQLKNILMNLGTMMMVGVELLQSPDFAEIQPNGREQLVETLKGSLSKSTVISPRYRQPW
jgi:hypothetical protein